MPLCTHRTDPLGPLCRYRDFEALSEVERGNQLPYNPASNLEYAVMGHWKRTEDDHNGIYGTWWVPLKDLAKTFEKDYLWEVLGLFEEEQKEAREEAIDILYAQAEANTERDE
jgi:hypothetical protein